MAFYMNELTTKEDITLAVTVRYSIGEQFSRTEIILNANHPQMSDLEFVYGVILHELGHTLGVGHSSYSNSIMTSSLGYRENYDLSQDDSEGIDEVVEVHQRGQAQKGNQSNLVSRSDDGVGSFPSCNSLSEQKYISALQGNIKLRVPLFNVVLNMVYFFLMIQVALGFAKRSRRYLRGARKK